jgi:hypothetical protein
VTRGGINREGLAAMLPVLDGKKAELREAIEAMPAGKASPFARIGSTHFARLVLLDEFPGRNGGTLADMPACLFFAAEFDISVAGYLDALCTLLPDDADAVFGMCVSYPGANAPPAFADWVFRHRIRAGFSIHANPQASVRQVVDSLRLREQIIGFAVQTRRLPPTALRDAWDSEDWGAAA